VFGRVLGFVDGVCGRMWFSCGKFLGDLVLDLISRHVKSTKGLGCHGNTKPHHTTSPPHQTFAGRASSRTVRVIPLIPLPQSFPPIRPVGTDRNLGCTCFPINALSHQKTTRPGSSFAVLAIENLLQPHRISA
jgi:hypothetical protein